MKTPLLACVAICSLLGATVAQAPSSPDWLGNFRFAPERLGPGTVTLVPQGGGPGVPYPSIQAAVNAGQERDTVLLSDGLFYGPGNRDIVVEGKNLTIRSRNGRERCIIDCQGKGRAFHFQGSAITSETLLFGISIVNGNVGTSGLGGGIYCEAESRPTIESCTIRECRSNTGGGLYYIALADPPGAILDCTIENNFASNIGGGLMGSGILIDRCRIVSNVGRNRGGGLYAASFYGTVRNTLIAGNTSPNGGGAGALVEGSGFVFENCTITNNHALTVGGGVSFANALDPEAVFEHCIFWGNTALKGSQINYPSLFGFSNATFRYCVIEGGRDGIRATGPGFPELIEILEHDPLFVHPAESDYHLSSVSPCIDAGDPAFSAAINEGDLDLQPRQSGVVDIGCDEVWTGLTLSLPTPGRAGDVNSILVTQASPSAAVFFFYGESVGSTDLSFGACRGLLLDIADATLLESNWASAQGEASYSQFVPAALHGANVFLQVVEFNGPNAFEGCRVSNAVSFMYP